tara:strand:- start:5647 stop:5790 length:144 start_codon:yes stop_codon:yes gene_type:complete
MLGFSNLAADIIFLYLYLFQCGYTLYGILHGKTNICCVVLFSDVFKA